MFKIIEGLPPDVLAIEASGKVTHDDYRDTLIPKAEAMIAKWPIKMLYVIGEDFTGFDHQALLTARSGSNTGTISVTSRW